MYRGDMNTIQPTTLTTVIALPGHLQYNLKEAVTLEEKIGEGGAGEVWLGVAKNANLIKDIGNVKVAVKMFAKGNL